MSIWGFDKVQPAESAGLVVSQVEFSAVCITPGKTTTLLLRSVMGSRSPTSSGVAFDAHFLAASRIGASPYLPIGVNIFDHPTDFAASAWGLSAHCAYILGRFKLRHHRWPGELAQCMVRRVNAREKFRMKESLRQCIRPLGGEFSPGLDEIRRVPVLRKRAGLVRAV